MCGFIVYAGENINKKKFESSLFSLQHRGPDSSRTIHLNKVSFGFNRLAIQDLSDSSMQPMYDLQGNYIVYNGEIYNFKKIKKELESLDYNFKTQGDVEVIMKSIEQWGFEKSLKKFEGMFSIIYFSIHENKLFASRDFFGMKPLFFSTPSSNEILFASEIKGIGNYKNKIEMSYQNSLNPIFFSGMSPKGRTMFKDIFSLNPGELLSVDLNSFQIKISKIFKLESLIDKNLYEEMSKTSANQISEIYSSVLSKSIEEHTVSDANCGVLFSAGLDSSLIAGELSMKGIDVDLFKYENNDLSDSIYTKSFLKFSGQNLFEVKDSDETFIFNLPKLIYHYETINKSEGVALGKVCELSRNKGYKALLTGDCADEIFAGYSTAQEYFIKSHISNLKGFNPILGLINKIIPGFKELFSFELNHHVSPYSSEFLDSYLDITLHGGKKKKQISNYREAYSFLSSKKEINSNAFLLDEIKNRLERFLIRADRFGMMESIELRLPYLTLPILELALNTPYYKKTSFKPSLKNKSLYSNKTILKRIAKSKGIPKNIIERRKIGTLISEINFKNELKCFENISLLNAGSFLKVNSSELKECVLLAPSKWELRRQIWNILSLEFLIDMFINGVHYTELEENIRKSLH